MSIPEGTPPWWQEWFHLSCGERRGLALRIDARRRPYGYSARDDQGYCRIHNLLAGRYYIGATGVWAILSMIAAGSPIQLREGQERRTVDFRLTPVRAVTLWGRASPLPPAATVWALLNSRSAAR